MATSLEHEARALTPNEQQALIAVLQRGTSSDAQRPVTTADRARWLAQVPRTRAGRTCGCGTCPSIELTDAAGRIPLTGGGRLVLEAEAAGALLMLFVDEDRLSYLELAPLEVEDGASTFPAPEDIGTS
ncbi:hypothetical protein [Kineococcus sp. SYSU DK005]|uniref:hypothetical protein n=1 Tax=Kineococcus sp. SYSU DK005 TaxID=3383126 RepID=UPI003D7CE890